MNSIPNKRKFRKIKQLTSHIYPSMTLMSKKKEMLKQFNTLPRNITNYSEFTIITMEANLDLTP